MVGTAGGLDLIRPFLDMLGRLPSPDEVAQAIVDGPGSAFGMVLVALYVREGKVLRLRGAHGLSEQERRGLDHAPLSADLPMCAAILEGEIVLTSEATIPEEFRDLAVVAEPWSSMRASQTIGSLVNVPIFLRGTAVGGYGFACDTTRAWTARDLAFLDAVGSCVALWLTQTETTPLPAPDRDDKDVRLSDRQVAILADMAAGRTIPAIAARIGYSPSTVKQEIRRIGKDLGTTDREATLARARELGVLPREAP